MKAHFLAVVALGTFSIAAVAAPTANMAPSSEPAPTKLSAAQMDQIVAGISPADQTQNPNDLNNGTNANSNGASGAPGGSFKAPGQTNNPNPGK